MQARRSQKFLLMVSFLLSLVWVVAACGRAGFSSWPDATDFDASVLGDDDFIDAGQAHDASVLDVGHDDSSGLDAADATLPDPVAVQILEPAEGVFINAAQRGDFSLSGICDPYGSALLFDSAYMTSQSSSLCSSQGRFAVGLSFVDSAGTEASVFVMQSDVNGQLNSDHREFMLDSLALAATGLSWAEGAFASTTSMHAQWAVSADPNLIQQRLELHQNSAQCQDLAPQIILINQINMNSYAITGETGQRYSFRIQSQDQAGNLALSACSSEIEVHPYSWRNLGPEYWPELQQRLQDAAAQGSNAEATAREIDYPLLTGLPISSFKYQGSALAPNGRIYGIPRVPHQIIELQVQDNADPVLTMLGPVLGGFDKWYGAALAFDGNIYCSASDYNFPLYIDPDNLDNSSEISSLDLSSDLNKWVGLTLAPNGNLYACPRDDAYVLEIDPLGASGAIVHRVGPSLGTASEKWWGGVLAPNGKIYCIPSIDKQILQIDPEDLSARGVKRLGPDFGTRSYNYKWLGGTIAPNGHIYAAPGSAGQVLEIVPEDIDNSRVLGPDFGTQGSKWREAVLAPNGKIYAVPDNFGRVLEIDPEDLTSTGIRAIGDDLGTSRYLTATLAPNGKIYAFPWRESEKLLEIDPHANANFDLNTLLNAHLNGQ